jgi:hypothetical protein
VVDLQWLRATVWISGAELFACLFTGKAATMEKESNIDHEGLQSFLPLFIDTLCPFTLSFLYFPSSLALLTQLSIPQYRLITVRLVLRLTLSSCHVAFSSNGPSLSRKVSHHNRGLSYFWLHYLHWHTKLRILLHSLPSTLSQLPSPHPALHRRPYIFRRYALLRFSWHLGRRFGSPSGRLDIATLLRRAVGDSVWLWRWLA